ncbi:MAG: LacI family transcriptional regulator [Oscillospiraceae bacterium]|nr:LacI family transcriptional regulator [Oscillospiraceae bacterium]
MPERRKSVTMSDVAREAGVSVTTVSHVLNQTAPISSETAERVLEAIHKTNYKPLVRTEAAFTGENRTIGILVPDISNEFYSRFAQMIYNTSWDNGYTALLCGMRHGKQVGLRYVKELIRNGINGLIIVGNSMEEKHILSAAERIPVVLGDCHILNHPVSSVITDNGGAMRQLIKRLKNTGYKRIGYISQDMALSNVHERYMGFKMGLEENGLPFIEKEMITSEFLRHDKITSAYQLFKTKLTKKEPLAEVYVCSSDLIAVGVLAALSEAGHRVPRDVGVVGFDNISLAAYTRPPLTTVAQNIEQLGRCCFNTLLRRIKNKNEPVQQTVITTKLVVRESVRL